MKPKELKTHFGIYKLTFPSGHFYIGKTIQSFESRIKRHFSQMLTYKKELFKLGIKNNFKALSMFDGKHLYSKILKTLYNSSMASDFIDRDLKPKDYLDFISVEMIEKFPISDKDSNSKSELSKKLDNLEQKHIESHKAYFYGFNQLQFTIDSNAIIHILSINQEIDDKLVNLKSQFNRDQIETFFSLINNCESEDMNNNFDAIRHNVLNLKQYLLLSIEQKWVSAEIYEPYLKQIDEIIKKKRMLSIW